MPPVDCVELEEEHRVKRRSMRSQKDFVLDMQSPSLSSLFAQICDLIDSYPRNSDALPLLLRSTTSLLESELTQLSSPEQLPVIISNWSNLFGLYRTSINAFLARPTLNTATSPSPLLTLVNAAFTVPLLSIFRQLLDKTRQVGNYHLSSLVLLDLIATALPVDAKGVCNVYRKRWGMASAAAASGGGGALTNMGEWVTGEVSKLGSTVAGRESTVGGVQWTKMTTFVKDGLSAVTGPSASAVTYAETVAANASADDTSVLIVFEREYLKLLNSGTSCDTETQIRVLAMTLSYLDAVEEVFGAGLTIKQKEQLENLRNLALDGAAKLGMQELLVDAVSSTEKAFCTWKHSSCPAVSKWLTGVSHPAAPTREHGSATKRENPDTDQVAKEVVKRVKRVVVDDGIEEGNIVVLRKFRPPTEESQQGDSQSQELEMQ